MVNGHIGLCLYYRSCNLMIMQFSAAVLFINLVAYIGFKFYLNKILLSLSSVSDHIL